MSNKKCISEELMVEPPTDYEELIAEIASNDVRNGIDAGHIEDLAERYEEDEP